MGSFRLAPALLSVIIASAAVVLIQEAPLQRRAQRVPALFPALWHVARRNPHFTRDPIFAIAPNLADCFVIASDHRYEPIIVAESSTVIFFTINSNNAT